MRFRAYYANQDIEGIGFEAPGWIEAVSNALAMATGTTGRLEAVESEEDGPEGIGLVNHPTGTLPD